MYYKILLLEIASNIIDITWFFQGLEQFKKILWRNSLIKIVGLFLTFALVRSQKDLYLYVFIYALTNLLGNLSLWVSIQKYIKFIKWNELRIFRHLKYVIGLFIPQIAVQIYTVLDKTMLGNLVSDISQVGYYEYGQKIVQMALLVLTSIGTVMLPRVSNLYKRGRKNEIKSLLNKVFKIVFLLSLPLIIGLIAIAPEFVVLFLGKDYKESIQIINWMSPILLFSGLSNVIGRQFFLPTQKNKEYTVSVVVGACSNVIFNFIFIPKFYAKGAALATSLSELLILLVQLYFSRRDFNYKNIFKGIYKYAIATMIMCFVLIGMSKIHISLFIDLVIKITTGTLIYFASLIIMKEEYTCGFLTKIRRSNK